MVSPEKIHLALNHMLFLLPLAALIPLGIGIASRCRRMTATGLAVALLGTLLTGVVMSTGEEAYERYEEGPVRPLLDAGAQAALEKHESVAHSLSKVMYAHALFCAGALVTLAFKKAFTFAAGITGAVLSLACIISGLIIADSGGKIRRPDFRSPATEATPLPAPDRDHD